MIREFLPTGMDGMANWMKNEFDSGFNQACFSSMQEFMAKEKDKTIESYAKAIAKTCKAFQAGWLNLWLFDYQIGKQTIPGEKMQKFQKDT